MNAWECTYFVVELNLWVKDWIISTSKPSNNSIGHYWKHLFGYTILNPVAYKCPPGTDITQYKTSSTPF